MKQEIIKYVEKYIIPEYNNFDKGHDINHAINVINKSLSIAKDYDVDENMVYVIAAYHDLGLKIERERHHIFSGEILLQDKKIAKYFNQEQLELMKEAIEDHRASNKQPPRSIYGCIVAEADREIDYQRIMYRCIQYRINKDFDGFDDLFEDVYQHMNNKYGEEGYLKLWLDVNKESLDLVRLALKDKVRMKNDCFAMYQNIKH